MIDRANVTNLRSSPSSPAAGWHRVFVPIGLFVAVFGVFNFAELPLGWKDRTGQFAAFLEATIGLGDGWIMPLLWAVKSVELTLGLVAIGALVRRSVPILQLAVVGWMAVFCGFAAMDSWAADRAELQEHTLYFVMFALLLGTVHVVSAVQRFSAHLRTDVITTSPTADRTVDGR